MRLKICELQKPNKFHWHLPDDQSWRVESYEFHFLNEIGQFWEILLEMEKHYQDFDSWWNLTNCSIWSKKLSWYNSRNQSSWTFHISDFMYPYLLCTDGTKFPLRSNLGKLIIRSDILPIQLFVLSYEKTFRTFLHFLFSQVLGSPPFETKNFIFLKGGSFFFLPPNQYQCFIYFADFKA
jgi:hypothetical protein